MSITDYAAADVFDNLTSDDIVDAWVPHALHDLSDAELIAAVADLVAIPHREAASSFELHAPLELMARARLLPLVHPDERRRARQRLAWVGLTYREAGTPVRPTSRWTGLQVTDLAAAVSAGDLDGVDAAWAQVWPMTSVDDLSRALADIITPHLGAAAHGAIALHHLDHLGAMPRSLVATLGSTLHELARHPDWKLSWFEHRSSEISAVTPGELTSRLRTPPSPGDSGSPFIFPTMSLTERSGLASSLLEAPTRTISVNDARVELLRTAAHSMLQDDPAHAPYGWTHCLTMPQATLSLARWCNDPQTAVAVAATYVLGFRSTLGCEDVDVAWSPERSDMSVADLTTCDPATAAAVAWHAAAQERDRLIGAMATAAAIHPDAHLAKYTLACIEAAAADPAAAALFLAAAAYLLAWWRQQPVEADPLGSW